jgi:flagellar hook-associated protein 2
MATINNRVRLIGLSSGMDTDAIVRDLMRLQRAPLDKMNQKQQLIQWKQSEYREVYNILNDFSRTFLNITNPSTNMLSSAQYKKFVVGVSNSKGEASTAVRVSATTDAYVGSHKIIVNRLATAAKESSESGISARLQSEDLRGDLELSGTKLSITIDGLTKEITFDSDYTIDSAQSGEAFASLLQTKIKEAFGVGMEGEAKVKVIYDDETGKISFSTAAGASKITLTSSADNDALSVLGIKSGASNRIDLSLTLEELAQSFGNEGGLIFEADPDDESGTEKLKFIINDKEFSFTKDTKLSTVISTINNDSTANVNMYYDTVTDKFTLVSKQTGAGTNIKITNVLGNFFGENSVTQINHNKEGFGSDGLDALVNIDGQDLVRSSNTFTEAGVTYELLNALPGEEITVGLTLDVDGIYESISNFVKSYNELIDKIYGKFNEKYNRDYPPLPDF